VDGRNSREGVTDKADTRLAATNEAPLDEQRRGVIQGFCAYLLWGLFPLYFHALEPSEPGRSSRTGSCGPSRSACCCS
jgi:hypothetical protein